MFSLESDRHFSTYTWMVVRINDGKVLNGLSGFVCFCIYLQFWLCLMFLFVHVFCERMARSKLSVIRELYAVAANGSDCFSLPKSRHLVHYRTATLANFWEWSLCARMPFNKSAIVLSPSRQQMRHCEAFAGRNFDCIRSWWGLHLNG